MRKCFTALLMNHLLKMNLMGMLYPVSCRVALLVLKPNQMARNIERMKGITSLMIQVLEKEGLVVVPVSLHAFSQLLDHEKIPYLMQKIRDHCASHNSVASII